MHASREKIIAVAKHTALAGLQLWQSGCRISLRLYRQCLDLCKKYLPLLLAAARHYLKAGWDGFKKFSLWFARTTGTLLHKLLLLLDHAARMLYTAIRTLIIIVSLWVIRQAERLQRRIRTEWPEARHRLYEYALLMRLNKPIGIFLLLWPTLWALWIAADGAPDLPLLIIFILGVIVMRSAGCVINDLVDRDLDPQVARTRDRPIAAGQVTPREALALAAGLLLFAFALVLCLNSLTIKLSFMAVALAILYPFTKRHTYMPQLFLGLAFGCAVPMAFAAETGSVPLAGWILLMVTILWAVVYDTLYAMVDREDDIRLGVKSTAILFEDADRGIIAVIQILVLLGLLLLGGRLELSRVYYLGLAAGACFFLYQQYLIIDRIPPRCFRAFLNNNWFGAAVFTGIYLHYQFN